MPASVLVLLLVLALGILPAHAARPPGVAELLRVVDPAALDAAERALLASLQGLVNRSEAAVWVDGGGFNRIIPEQLEEEGARVVRDAMLWELAEFHRDAFDGVILCDVADRSLNVAFSLAGVRRALVLDASLERRAQGLGLRVLADVRAQDEVSAFSRWQPLFARGLLAEQPPAKPLHLRDLLVARGAFVFSDVSPERRTDFVRALGPQALVLGWGKEEYPFIRDLSRGGGAAVPSDWALNLSALGLLDAEVPARARPPTPAPVQPGERVVAFVMSDGDNVQWLLNSFTEEGRGWWASPRRGHIPMTWEMAPLLMDFAPRVMAWFYARATAGGGDDFVAGPSGHGYFFPGMTGRELPVLARQAARASVRAQLPLITVLNAGGTMDDARAYLVQPGVHGVLYKDYAPYNQQRGRILWHDGRPAVSYRFLLWEPKPENGPEGVARAVAEMPADAANDPRSYALVNVHAWSWKSLGGPFEAVKRTVDLLPAQTRVVTAGEFFALLHRHREALQAHRP
ncbi:MAG: hypothetical protein ACKVYV_17670 [Limisphaerales bacterium]